MADYTSDDARRDRPPGWAEMFASEGDGEREVRIARERSQGRTRKSSAQAHQEAADSRQVVIRQDRQADREAVLDRTEAARAERERYRGVRSADILAEPIVGPAPSVRPRQSAVGGDDYDPVEYNRAKRKDREATKRRERGW